MEVIIDGIQYVPQPELSDNKSLLDALNIRFDSDAGKSITIRHYLHALLTTLWVEGEGFSGKRPFGNSGWELELYAPLIEHGFISGSLDEDGYIQTYEREEAESYVFDLITAAFYGVKNED